MFNVLNEVLQKNRANNTVVIIKGNPEKMVGHEKRAHDYYQAIVDYIQHKGYRAHFDEGKPHTCPDLDVAFWIGHSRGADRIVCIPDDQRWRFLEFGVKGGVIHPKDEQHQDAIRDHRTTKQLPIKEHFVFTRDQQNAIDNLINRL